MILKLLVQQTDKIIILQKFATPLATLSEPVIFAEKKNHPQPLKLVYTW